MANMIKRIAGILGLHQGSRRDAEVAREALSKSTGPPPLKAAQAEIHRDSAAPPPLGTHEPAPNVINVAEGTVEVKNRLGLHMRPTTMVAKTAIKYLSTITIARGNKQASARSASSLERLKAKPGTHLNIRAEGPDAKDALRAVTALFDRKFGED
jgi:phosphocarrier protein HPr